MEFDERKRSRHRGNQPRPSGWTGRTTFCQPRYQFLSSPGSREDQAVGCRGPFSKALFTPLFPWCPQLVGLGRRTTKKPGQGDASLLVLELFLRTRDPHQDPRPQLLPPAGYTLSQGYLFHQLLQREREMMMMIIPEAWSSDTDCTGAFQRGGSEVRLWGKLHL